MSGPDSVVVAVGTSSQTGRTGFRWEEVSHPNPLHRRWRHPNFLFNGYDFLSLEKSCRGVTLNIHLYLGPRSRLGGVKPLLRFCAFL
jgi:hypothetical protein